MPLYSRIMDLPTRLAKDRFIGDVDDFFLCPRCSHIVLCPKECESCQILLCEGCTFGLEECPSGGHQLVTHDISRFPKKIYEAMQLKCCNSPAGCEFIGVISVVLSHESDCDFSQLKCANPVCDQTFLKRQKDQRHPLVCSDLCMKVCHFQDVLQQNDHNAALHELFTCLMSTKVTVEQELRSTMQPTIQELDVLTKELEEFEKLKEAVVEEIELRKTTHHSGKWNQQAKQWSCCADSQVLSPGCRTL